MYVLFCNKRNIFMHKVIYYTLIDNVKIYIIINKCLSRHDINSNNVSCYKFYSFYITLFIVINIIINKIMLHNLTTDIIS